MLLVFLPSCPCRCPVENRSEGSLYRCTAVLGLDARGPGGRGGQKMTDEWEHKV